MTPPSQPEKSQDESAAPEDSQPLKSRGSEPGGSGAAVEPGIERSDDGRAREIGGRPGPDPTRYGDWEKNGRCIDF